tara:strand:+ start:800 stop:1279 length:480 start_codon:yes stop_codon:yes gene_type:complete
MSGIYCTLDEAYGDVFENKPKPKPPLSIKINRKNKNEMNDFSNFTRYKQLENKPQRFPKTNNFDIDNLELEEEDPNKKVQEIQKNNKDSLLDQNYMSNDSLLLRLLEENKVLQTKIDQLLSQNKRNNFIDIIMYIITGIFIIIILDIVINKMKRINLTS